MKRFILALGVLLLLGVTGCGSGAAAETVAAAAPDGTGANGNPLAAALAGAELTERARLALGTMQLNETEWPVDETQAAQLLPLWQALIALDDSATTAEAELNALVRQIESTLSPEQQGVIAEMELSLDGLDLAFGRGRGAEEGGEPARGGLRGGAGGLPGGGRPGGGGPGGLPGGAGGPDPDAIATRQAEAGRAFGPERFATQAVVRWLQQITGEAPADAGNPFTTVLEVVGEATGLSDEEIRAEMDASSLEEIIEANGGDVGAVEADLVAALADTNLAGRVDLDEWVAATLNAVPEVNEE